MSYADVKIVTLSEGEVTHLHVGLKGTMNAIFSEDLADKTRRGQPVGSRQANRAAGNAYAKTVVKEAAERAPSRSRRTANDHIPRTHTVTSGT